MHRVRIPFRPIAGGAPTVEELTRDQDAVVQEANQILEALGGEFPQGEQADHLRSLNTRFEDLDSQIAAAREHGGTSDAFRARAQAIRDRQGPPTNEGRPPLYQGGNAGDDHLRVTGDGHDEPLTPGEMWTRSSAYEAWIKQFPGGGPSKGAIQSDSVPYPGLMRQLGLVNATEKMRAGQALTPSMFRALVTSADASAGYLVRPDYRGLLEPGLVRPLTIRDLVTVIPVTTDAIEYVKENSRLTNAAPVTEAVQLLNAGDTGATKPEGGLTFATVTDTVQTIAEWVPATRRIMADAPALRAYIDQYLTDDLSIELEDQIIAGSGTSPNLRGLLNTVGIQTAGPPAGTANMLDVIRTARRLVQINARTFPTAVVINPADAESIDILKFGGGTPTSYVAGGPFGAGTPPRVWGMALVESEAVPAGTALVGDFRRAVLFDREDVNISVGTVGDDFIRNIVRILAEMRVGFGVLRPSAFVSVDLVP